MKPITYSQQMLFIKHYQNRCFDESWLNINRPTSRKKVRMVELQADDLKSICRNKLIFRSIVESNTERVLREKSLEGQACNSRNLVFLYWELGKCQIKPHMKWTWKCVYKTFSKKKKNIVEKFLTQITLSQRGKKTFFSTWFWWY